MVDIAPAAAADKKNNKKKFSPKFDDEKQAKERLWIMKSKGTVHRICKGVPRNPYIPGNIVY